MSNIENPWHLVRRVGYTLCLLALLSACHDSNDDSGVYTLRLEYPPGFNSSAQAGIRLYGTNRTYADNPATIIANDIVAIDGLGTTLALIWPSDAHELIDTPPVEREEDALYYFYVVVDLDNDGMICLGDLRQDFDATPFFTLDRKPDSTITIFLTERDTDFCTELSADVPVLL